LAVCPPLTVTPQLNFSGMALIFGILLPIILMTMALRCFHDRKFQSYLVKRAPGLLSKRQAFRLFASNFRSKDDDLESSDSLDYPRYNVEADEYITGNEISGRHGDYNARRSPRQTLLPPSYDVYRINIVMDNLAVSLKNHRMLLQGVSGCFRAGRMTAVMGPSGAGKSVLLSVIAGRLNYGQISGRIAVNNSEGIYALKKYKEVVGFVPQEDIMHRNLTVSTNHLKNQKQKRNK
jgi:ABC-type multidrug transport system fused ATPase/permease subunit